MPRKSAQASVSDLNAADGGVAAVDRALSLLAAFSVERPMPNLAELADQTRLYKSTILRLLASLEHAGLVRRLGDGRYALASEVARLQHIYAASFAIEAVVMPVLRDLVAGTQESAAFYVRRGAQRLCLCRVDSPQPVRDHMQAGALLPLDRGSSGRVLLAFSGEQGALYDQIRRDRLIAIVGDRVPEIASIAAPVFGVGGELVGAIALTMPSDRFEQSHDKLVVEAARRLTAELGSRYPG
ncbi:MAG: IclR family transcriptional regulator [Phreatobacter sp.]